MLGDEAKAARLCTATVQSMELSQPSTEKVTQPGGESNTTDLNESENTTCSAWITVWRPEIWACGSESECPKMAEILGHWYGQVWWNAQYQKDDNFMSYQHAYLDYY